MVKKIKRPVTKEPPAKITVPHVRANDFRDYFGDGVVLRLEGDFVVITPYVNDTITVSENMELVEAVKLPNGLASGTYKPTGLEERRQRTDTCALRMSIASFQDTVNLFISRVQAVTAPENKNEQ